MDVLLLVRTRCRQPVALLALLPLLALTFGPVVASAAPESVPFDSDRWSLQGEEHRLETYLGRPALYLDNARAILDDVDFREGVIEFDVAFTADRGFSGVMFHRQGDGDFEQFYLRPHNSGKPDACQYQPVFGGRTAWQILYGPGFGATLTHRYDEWQHVRLVISGGQADVYVNSEEPVLFIDDLMRRAPGGGLGLLSSFAPAHFSAFRYEETAALPLEGEGVNREPLAEGAIRTWRVSSAFEEERLTEVTDLAKLDPSSLSWADLSVEVNGVANLARTLPTGGNTVLASVTITSEREQTVLLDFGFSDRVHAFVNGRLVFVGNDSYRTRDHRFLGTVGLFDTLALELNPGANDVTFAISEDFGGFAIAGRLRNRSGVRISSPIPPPRGADR